MASMGPGNCAVMAAKQLVEYLEKGNIVNSVNFPNVSIPHTGAARVCLIHKNVPNILSQITSAISAEGINIENMSNASRGDYAYTIVETATDVPAGAKAVFEAIEGMIRVTLY